MKLRLLFLFLFPFYGLLAQIVNMKTPPAYDSTLPENLPVFSFSSPNRIKLLEEDAERQQKHKEDPFRFAVAYKTAINLKTEGLKSRDAFGNNSWQLRIDMPDAYGIGLIFNNFNIPYGAELYIFNSQKTQYLGAITAVNNNRYGVLSTLPVQGSSVIVLYVEPANVPLPGILEIGYATHVYRDIFSREKGFGDSGNCNINVVCPEGENWEDQIRSVAMIVTGNGTRWCTGVLINNVQHDNMPYFLTANHCTTGNGDDPATWSVIFNYKSPVCDPSENGLLGNSVFGAEVLAYNAVSDFALLQLNQQPPAGYGVYFSGWSRLTGDITATTGIHHPSGDVMKISKDFDPPVLSGYFDEPGEDYWKVTDWDLGTTEGGSSGSPLYNGFGQIIGQLRGGQAACNNDLPDYYGAFYKSWDGETSSQRLRDWLDPGGLNPDSIGGHDPLTDALPELTPDRVKIYPNPATGRVLLEITNIGKPIAIVLTDAAGRKIKIVKTPPGKNSFYEIPLDGIAPGFYFVRIEIDDVTLSLKLTVK